LTLTPDRDPKRRLDQIDPHMARHLVVFNPDADLSVDLLARARKLMPNLAPASEVIKVLKHNPTCFFASERKSHFDPANPTASGVIYTLPLNRMGLEHLAFGTFNALAPDLRMITGPNERPAGIYVWCVFLPGTQSAMLPLFMEKLSVEPYAGVTIYGRPITEAGRRYGWEIGMTNNISIYGIGAPENIWHFPRSLPVPLYDSYVPGAMPGTVGVTVARTMEDLARVIAIRSAVYVGEQECPYDEEYDGNDLSATHLLAYVGDEPVGCLRIRFFAGFAKIERLAVRKEFRKTRAAFQLVRAGFKLCQKKGYARVYGHSQVRLVNFWSRFGFRVPENARRFVFSDFDYVEIVADIEPDADAVAIGADPYVIIRPEGRWHRPGILEESAARQVTRPSVARRH
jgi:predicted GNAT family N-acyltransferase